MQRVGAQVAVPSSSTAGNWCALWRAMVVLICTETPICLQVFHAVDGGVERARNSAEAIVGCGIGSIERNRDALDAGLS